MPNPERKATEEVLRERRTQEVFDARQSVLELEQQIERATADPQQRLSRESIRKAYQMAVKRYIRVVEPILNPPSIDWTSEYWIEKPIASYTRADGSELAIIGLNDYLYLPTEEELTTITTSAPDPDWAGGDIERETTVVDRPPKQISELAFRKANTALSFMGFNVGLHNFSVGVELAKASPGIGAHFHEDDDEEQEA